LHSATSAKQCSRKYDPAFLGAVETGRKQASKDGRVYMVQEDWPFDEAPNLAVISTRQVMERGAPILFVSHDEEDEGWQFLTGGLLIEEDARVVALRRIWLLDPSISELADLLLGWQASRTTLLDPWRRNPRSGS
jgi:hypothetical protein